MHLSSALIATMLGLTTLVSDDTVSSLASSHDGALQECGRASEMGRRVVSLFLTAETLAPRRHALGIPSTASTTVRALVASDAEICRELSAAAVNWTVSGNLEGLQPSFLRTRDHYFVVLAPPPEERVDSTRPRVRTGFVALLVFDENRSLVGNFAM